VGSVPIMLPLNVGMSIAGISRLPLATFRRKVARGPETAAKGNLACTSRRSGHMLL
jgi:hypothetical protein